MKLARNSAAKLIAVLLCIASTVVGAVSLVIVFRVAQYGGYNESQDQKGFVNSMFPDQVYEDISAAAEYYSLIMNGQPWTQELLEDYASRFDASNTHFFFTITDYDTQEVLLSSYTDSSRYWIREDYWIAAADYYGYDVYDSDVYGTEALATPTASIETPSEAAEVIEPEAASLRHVIITGFVCSNLGGVRDTYAQIAEAGNMIYGFRNTAITAGAVSCVIFLLFFLFLMYGAGRRSNTNEIVLRLADRIPVDLFFLLAAGAMGLAGYFALWYESALRGPYTLKHYALLAAAAAMEGTLLMILSLSLATRFKCRNWWKNSLLFLFFHWMGEVLHHPLHRLKELILAIPLVWKTLLLGAVMVLLEIWCLYQLYWNGSTFPIVLLNLLAALGILSAVVCMKKLQTACRAIADGDLDYRVDTSHMYLDYRAHGEDLNRIGSGISVAVEERLKSERFRTELITNVSHDLKTPLTSIVNYVHLLSKLDLPEDARTYVEVLQRQSARLKKLTEDLVEASKASTGNLSVEISPVNLGELVAQVTGEYEERFEKSGLHPVVTIPEETVSALGDGRYLWRIMDNLLSNVCKYALPGTRVYIDAALRNGGAIISVKNISRDRLNVSAEELMERFVRGDASRNTEGSGLGLSIALSLAELMGGTLSLIVDGDLFKAEVRLPPAPPEQRQAEDAAGHRKS